MRELERHKAVQPLLGLGCSPVLVKGNKDRFLGWIGKALKQHSISIPESNGAVPWKLPKKFLLDEAQAGNAWQATRSRNSWSELNVAVQTKAGDSFRSFVTGISRIDQVTR